MRSNLPAGSEHQVSHKAAEYRKLPLDSVAARPPIDEIDLRDVWATLRRRWRTILATTLVIAAAVAVYTFSATPVWYARTLIRVDDPQQRSLASPALEVLSGFTGGGGQIETELRILHTRPIAEDVVDSLDLNFVVSEPAGTPRQRLFTRLDFGRDTPEQSYEIHATSDGRYRLRSIGEAGPSADQVFAAGDRVELSGGIFVIADLRSLTNASGEPVPTEVRFHTLPFQVAVEGLLETLSVSRPDREANVLQIAYRTTDRGLVHEVPNSHAESFIERRIESQKADARSTVAFLETEVEGTRKQLEGMEAQLQNFREGEQIVALGPQAEAQVQRLATVQTQRMQLQTERQALLQRLTEIEGGERSEDLRRIATFPTFFGNQAVTTILQALTRADSTRAALLTRLKPEHPDVVAIDERISDLERQLGRIGRDYVSSLSDQISALDSEIARFGEELEQVPEREIEYARFQRQVDMLSELYTVLQTRLKEAQVKEAIDDSSVRIVERAIEPLKPVSPRPVRAMALATLLGLVLGVVVAFVREYMDKRLHSSDRIEALFGLPTMARIPALALGSYTTSDRTQALIALEDAQSIGAESFRNLRTNVRFVRRGHGANEIVITSPSPGEGKSLTAANLAVTMGQQGRSVLLLDADMRRPVQHRQFEVSQSPGLSECLLADELLEEAIQPTDLEGLYVLAAGQTAPNPAELLDSARMDRLLAALRARFEAVIIDSPPVLAVTDSAVLVPKTDGVILVVRAEKTDKDAIALAIQQLRQVDADLLGIVVNDAKAEGSYQSFYREYYGDAKPTGWRRLLARLRGMFS